MPVSEIKPESDSRDPKQIALAVFRFRARRGIGVFYTLVSTVPLLASILQRLHLPGYVALAAMILLMITVWFVSRAADMKGFYNMTRVIDLYESGEETGKQTSSWIKVLRGLLLFASPFVLFSIFLLYNQNMLAVATIFAWVIVWISLSVFRYSRRPKDSILRRRIEDWVALPFAMLILILAALPPHSASHQLLLCNTNFHCCRY